MRCIIGSMRYPHEAVVCYLSAALRVNLRGVTVIVKCNIHNTILTFDDETVGGLLIKEANFQLVISILSKSISLYRVRRILS